MEPATAMRQPWLALLGLVLAASCTGAPPPVSDSAVAQTPTSTATATPAPSRTATPAPRTPTPSPMPTTLVVELDERMLTDNLNAALSGRWQVETGLGPATVRNLWVQLRNDQATVGGEAQTPFVSLPLRVTTFASARANGVIITVREASVGGVLLPEDARRQIELTLQAEVDRALARERFLVESLSIGDGVLTLRGRRT